MLRELHISNFAVISDARIELAAGLNCFTGATGAGKSLVIGAIEVLLGLRSAGEMLRPGADEGRVSGVFEVKSPETLAAIEALTDISVSADGGELLLTRRLFASGRGSISLNGQPLTLGMLKQVAEHLVDIHGQHDHQYLLKPTNQLQVIDHFGGLHELRERYQAAYGDLQAARDRLAALSGGEKLRARQLELYRFQTDEIDAAELDAAEYDELHARSAVLHNLGKLKKEAGAVHSALYEMDGSVLERVKMMVSVLAELSMLDRQLEPVAKGIRDGALQLEEAAFDLSRYLNRLDLDPGESAEVDERLNSINRVLNKYGGAAVADALGLRGELGRMIAKLEKSGADLSSLAAEIGPLTEQVKALGAQLSVKRKAVAKRLSPLIESELADLGMEKARFTVGFGGGDFASAGAGGFDVIEFIAQTNPGQLAQPLRKIASGGELSRIMLALKGILAAGDRISVLVFDEIDSNVGGRLGSTIGNRLRRLAGKHQVLCITHLPQIASYADRHLTVSKEVVGETTKTTVRVMEGEERIGELAEMTGGPRITETTRAQARELLEAARAEFGEAKNEARGKRRKG